MVFFHSQASQRHRRNKIRGIENIDGILKIEDEDMKNIIRDYFMGIFSSNGVDDTNHLLSGVKRCINENMNQILTTYKEDEIVAALNSIGPTKAAGPMGSQPCFSRNFGTL